jgi:Xaa-Pro aminopeptidase
MIPVKSFSERRRHLASQMQKGVAIIPTAPEQVRNRDAYYPYRFDSYFYYLTGFGEPEAVLVIVAGVDEGASKHILFCRDKDLEREIWDGFRYGPEAAREAFDFDETYPIFKLDENAAQVNGRSARCVLCIRARYGMGHARDRLDQSDTATGAYWSYRARWNL